MSLVPDDLLNAARVAAHGLLDALCEIHRPTHVEDDSFGGVDIWEPVATLVPCSLGAGGGGMSGEEQEQATNRIGQVASWVVKLGLPAPEVRLSDRIFVFQEDQPTRQFEVLGGGPHSVEILRSIPVVEMV